MHTGGLYESLPQKSRHGILSMMRFGDHIKLLFLNNQLFFLAVNSVMFSELLGEGLKKLTNSALGLLGYSKQYTGQSLRS